jgi:two-component system alkaline phosphatase synthesis response regulator PhoP
MAKRSKSLGSILLVDDEPAVTSLFKKHLEKSGFRLKTASNSDKARELLKATAFDLVILDIYLGEESGEQIISFLKSADTPNRETPIIAMSGRMKADLVQRIQKDVDGFFVKPLDFNRVVRMLKELAERDEE